MCCDGANGSGSVSSTETTHWWFEDQWWLVDSQGDLYEGNVFLCGGEPTRLSSTAFGFSEESWNALGPWPILRPVKSFECPEGAVVEGKPHELA